MTPRENTVWLEETFIGKGGGIPLMRQASTQKGATIVDELSTEDCDPCYQDLELRLQHNSADLADSEQQRKVSLRSFDWSDSSN